jgi:hypothetical protein
MKKKYIMPHTKVVKIKFETSLLAGSVNGNADLNDGGGSSVDPNSLEVEFE